MNGMKNDFYGHLFELSPLENHMKAVRYLKEVAEEVVRISKVEAPAADRFFAIVKLAENISKLCDDVGLEYDVSPPEEGYSYESRVLWLRGAAEQILEKIRLLYSVLHVVLTHTQRCVPSPYVEQLD